MSRFAVMGNASRYLQRIAFILFIVQGSISAKAQQNWYLFIQSESSQSFYVRIGETIYSSSPVGHLVINGLRDSTYRLAIGFPQSQYREQQFSIPVKRKDYGFELKKASGRSWVLYDWQNQETIRSPRVDSLLYGERKKDDGFASLMAAVVNDSAVLYASVVKTEPPKKTEVAKDTAVAQLQKNIDSAKTEPVVVKKETKDTIALVEKKPIEEVKTPAVTKINETTGSQEKKLVFLDNSIGIKKDTITVIIPFEKDTVVKEEKAVAKKDSAEQNQSLMDAVATNKVVDSAAMANAEKVKAEAEARAREKIKEDSLERVQDEKRKAAALALVQEEKRKADSITTAQVELKKADSIATARAEMKKVDSTPVVVNESEPTKPTGLVMVNSDCAKFATDHDVDKLRIKMLAEKDAGNRIFVAHKAFKNMCFATRHIKGLSELFPNDELRFRFFETAWPFVSDTVQFKTLEETLTDQFFITRFRTLLRR